MINFVDQCEIGQIGYLAVLTMASCVGCSGVKKLFFKRCGTEFATDLVELKYDNDVLQLSNFLSPDRVVEVYTDCVGETFGDENELSSEDEDYVSEGDIETDLDSLSGSDKELGKNDEDLDKEISLAKQKKKMSNSKSGTQGRTKAGLIDDNILNEGYVSSDGFSSWCCSDEKNEIGEPEIVFNKVDIKSVKFEIGMKFRTGDEFRDVVRHYSVQNSRDIKFKKNAKEKMILLCGDGKCHRRMYVSKSRGEETVQIQTSVDEHTCDKKLSIRNVKPKWIAKQYLDRIADNPKWPLKNFRITLAKELHCTISKSTAYDSLTHAKKMLQGSSAEQYLLLEDYLNELKRANPGSTCVMKVLPNSGPNKESTFVGLYICWAALKRGFIEGCRPIIGIDGCHLTGPHKGVLLTAVAIDANNCMYPFGYAVVDVEKYTTWKWFLKLIRSDLNMARFQDYTIVSDKQKGLIKAVEKLFPGIAHRFCVRHLYNNFKQSHKGIALKDLIWKAARASTKSGFEAALEEMRVLDFQAYEWLSDKPPEQWTRSYFTCQPKCEILTNNLCESFNSCIKEARGESILTMLEEIRSYLMDLVMRKKAAMMNKDCIICPLIKKELEEVRSYAHLWIASFNGDDKFECDGPNNRKYECDLQRREYGCRKWQLSGFPCVHAISAMNIMGYDPINYVHGCYSKETYMKTYANVLNPINGRDMWSKGANQTKVIPPYVPIKVGKPKKARRRDNDEDKEKSEERARYKRSRKGTIMRCRQCGQQGHNSRRCGRPDVPKITPRSQVQPDGLLDESDSSDGDGEEYYHVGVETEIGEWSAIGIQTVNVEPVMEQTVQNGVRMSIFENQNEDQHVSQPVMERDNLEDMISSLRDDGFDETETLDDDEEQQTEIHNVRIDQNVSNDTWVEAMRKDGLGLPNEHWEKPPTSGPNKTKKAPTKIPVRKSQRLLNTPRKDTSKKPKFYDLTENEEPSAQESVTNQNIIHHDGSVMPTSPPLEKGHYKRKGVVYMSLEAVKKKMGEGTAKNNQKSV